MLNPIREMMSRVGREAQGRPSPFVSDANRALELFRAERVELERQVRRGEITLKSARESAGRSASSLKNQLESLAENYSPVSRVFLERLVEADKARRKSRDTDSLAYLQRETNRLLREGLIEQQLQSRGTEFEGKTFVRPLIGGQPSPTLDSLLAFHTQSQNAGDEVALEWTRRQLEGFRSRVVDEHDVRKIERATQRPDRVSPPLVQLYVEAMASKPEDEVETFVARAVEEADSSACVAAFVLARQQPEGPGCRWVRQILAALPEFPDAALATLRGLEAEARQSEAEAAQAQSRFASATAEFEARLEGLEPPTERELERLGQALARPLARPGEPIGLNLARRGAIDPGEIDAIGSV